MYDALQQPNSPARGPKRAVDVYASEPEISGSGAFLVSRENGRAVGRIEMSRRDAARR